jgi:sigma-E factor negative regulatory protein RseA
MPKDISLFVDGELDQESIDMILKKIKNDEELQHKWFAYHLIGDTLRETHHVSPEFCQRFSALLAKEPIHISPRRRFTNIKVISASIAASVAAIAMVTTVMLNIYKVDSVTALWSKPAEIKLVNVPNDQEYLMAHQEFSSSTVVQGVAPYARTVSSTSQDAAQ